MTVGELPTHSHSGSISSTSLTGGWLAKQNERSSWGIISNTSTGNIINSGGSNQNGTQYSINATHSHTVTVNNTGSNQSHNNMQPYIGVYIWKRIN